MKRLMLLLMKKNNAKEWRKCSANFQQTCFLKRPMFHIQTRCSVQISLISDFVGGQETDIHIQVKNSWHKPVVVYSISASLYNPDEPANIFRNLTAQRMWMDVGRGEEATLIYKMKPEGDEGTKVGLLLRVDFTDETFAKMFQKVGFNQTVNISEALAQPHDIQSVFIYIVGIVALVGSVMMAKSVFSGKKAAGAKRKTSSPPPLKSPVDSDWLPSTLKKEKSKKKE